MQNLTFAYSIVHRCIWVFTVSRNHPLPSALFHSVFWATWNFAWAAVHGVAFSRDGTQLAVLTPASVHLFSIAKALSAASNKHHHPAKIDNEVIQYVEEVTNLKSKDTVSHGKLWRVNRFWTHRSALMQWDYGGGPFQGYNPFQWGTVYWSFRFFLFSFLLLS